MESHDIRERDQCEAKMIGQWVGGRYQIRQVLGSGGFGTTYLAEDRHRPGQPTCVVKHLKPARTDPEFLVTARRLFNAEAEVLERIGHHDRIPRLLAHFEQDQEFFLVEELIDGQDLSHELSHGQTYSETQVIALLDQILEVLSYVHRHHVIHRDLKPSNLIRRCSDGQIVLIDFGAVKQIQDASIVTAVGSDLTIAIGSPGYLPDEQMAGKPRFASDVYAAGVIGIQALTGKIAQMIPVDPGSSELLWQDRVQISPGLRQVLEKMVRYDYRERYSSAQEALVALRGLAPAPASATTFTAIPTPAPASPLPAPPLPAPAFNQELDTTLPIPSAASRATLTSPNQPAPVSQPMPSTLQIRPQWVWGAAAAILGLTLGVGILGGQLLSRRSVPTSLYWVQADVTSTQTWQARAPITHMILSSDDRQIICSTANGLIKLWDAESGDALPTLRAHPDRIGALALGPGQHQGISGGENGQIIVWDLQSSQPIQTLRNQGPVRALAVAPDGRQVVSGSEQGQITAWSLASGASLRTVQAGQAESDIGSLDFSPDGKLLAIADHTEQVQIWHLETERQILTLLSDFPVDQVLFSPVDPILIGRSADGVRLWDLQTGEMIRHLSHPFTAVQSFAISDDGRTLVTGTDFRQPSVKIWDTRTGELLHELGGHRDGVSALALSSDGQVIYSAGIDGEIKRWQVARQ